MIEKRKFPRFRFDADCTLLCEGQSHEGRVVNVSLGGAMISLNDSAMIAQDAQCLLRIVTGNAETADEIAVSVVYASFTCIGVSFLAFTADSHPRLYAQIAALTLNPEKYRVAYP